MPIKKGLGLHAAAGALAVGFGSTALVIGAAPALSNGVASKTVSLTANVPSLCKIDGATGETAAATMEIPVTDGAPHTDPLSLQMDVSCNTPSDVRLTSEWGGVRHSGFSDQLPDPVAMADFALEFDYLAEVTLTDGTVLANLDTANGSFGSPEDTGLQTALDETSASPMGTTVVLEVTPGATAGGKPLMAGMYGDNLKFEIIPKN